jgi:hypothetical protein
VSKLRAMTNLARPSMARLVSRLLDTPDLVQIVQSAAPSTLLALVEEIGLEDAGELVALATPAQLLRMLDADLWTARPGAPDGFDDDRFSIWLQVLAESGAGSVAEKMAALDEELVAYAFSRQVFVVDGEVSASQAFMQFGSLDTRGLDQALKEHPSHEIGRWLVIARAHDGWDAIVDTLTALDEHDSDFADALLGRLAKLTDDEVDMVGGINEALTKEQTLEEDAAAAHEDRRESEGFVPPRQATAFLHGAKEATLDALVHGPADPLAKLHLRGLDASPVERADDRLAAFLRGHESEAPPTRPLLTDRSTAHVVRDALDRLFDRDPEAHARRQAELAFLANVLVAAQGLRPLDAAQRALEACERGLQVLAEHTGRRAVDLAQEDLVRPFRIAEHVRTRTVTARR